MQTNPESAAVEAVAWYTDDHLSDRSATTWDPETAARWEAKGWKVWMLHKGSDVMALQARHEVALDALRGEVERLRTELSARGDYVNEALIARADAAERRVAELEAVLGAVVADPTWRTSDNTLWPRLTNALRQEKPE